MSLEYSKIVVMYCIYILYSIHVHTTEYILLMYCICTFYGLSCCLSHACHMVVIWLSYGCHVAFYSCLFNAGIDSDAVKYVPLLSGIGELYPDILGNATLHRRAIPRYIR